MAINFPATVGQPTDGTFTYVAAGITYSWNGESWTAAGSGATATDLTVFSVSNASPSGNGSLSYNSNTGDFTFTPPSLSSYLTSVGVLNNHTDVNINSAADKQLLKYDAFSGDWVNFTPGASSGLDADLLDGQHGSYYRSASNLNAGTLSSDRLSGTYNIDITGSAVLSTINLIDDVTISNPSSGQVLSYNGSAWVNSANVSSRTTAAATANSVSNNGIANITITTPPTYALLKIQTSHAAWVTLYTDTTSRTNDASRIETTDPTPGSGVIAEVITTGSTTQLITPGTIGFNSGGTGATYLKVVNKSGSTASIIVTLHYVPLEG